MLRERIQSVARTRLRRGTAALMLFALLIADGIYLAKRRDPHEVRYFAAILLNGRIYVEEDDGGWNDPDLIADIQEQSTEVSYGLWAPTRREGFYTVRIYRRSGEVEYDAIREALAAHYAAQGPFGMLDAARVRGGNTSIRGHSLAGYLHNAAALAILAALLYALAWRSEWPSTLRAVERQRALKLINHRCPGCGYSLAGLPESAVCPECGDVLTLRPAGRGPGPG